MKKIIKSSTIALGIFLFSGVAVSAAADMKDFGHLSSVKLMYGSAAASDTSVTYRTNGWCGSNNAAVVVYITDAYGNAVVDDSCYGASSSATAFISASSWLQHGHRAGSGMYN